ncbi:MBL fold metallo-hydrolase [Haloflavibacter putidus]|nr:MBL fold metallo-hydrolase [Haloflavibacter putidus]
MMINFSLKKNLVGLGCALMALSACKEAPKDNRNPISAPAGQESELLDARKNYVKVQPVEHASFVLDFFEKTIYIDPVGNANSYTDFQKPDILLLTDIHPDHLQVEVLQTLITSNTKIIAPSAVANKLPAALKKQTKVLNNFEEITLSGSVIKALPMYNLPESAESMHPKGRGNGYLLQEQGKRIYIAGDTEDIPEMRNLKDINIAFIPMNLPYTMTVEDAADAVLDFKPHKVYPYHYRGKEGFSDIEKFKNIVNTNNPKIEVILLDWYPEK